MFSKYRNKRSKKAKLTAASVSSSSENVSLSLEEKRFEDVSSKNQIQNSEIDESVADAYKLSLNRDSADWNEVCHKWKLTYSMRQKDLGKMESLEFLRNWSKLTHSKAPDLVRNFGNSDFSLTHFNLQISDQY